MKKQTKQPVKQTLKQRRNKADREQLISLMGGKTVIIIPHKLTLFGITYKTKVQKTVLSSGKSVNGYIDHLNKTIYLKEHNGIDKTYIHEVIHARDKFFGLKKNVPETEKESLVCMEAEWWVQFFRQIFPVAELIKNTDTTEEADPNLELIKKLQADIKDKDKQIEKLTAQLNTKKKKKAKSSVKQTAQKLKTKLTRRTK